MSLATRLSAFFLTALALVLLGFSGTLYLLAQAYLHGQIDERLRAALDTLSVAVEHESDGLEWEPQGRRFDLGRGTEAEEVRWEVRSGRGRLEGRSANLGGADLWPADLSPADDPQGICAVDRDGHSWKVAWRRLQSPASSSATPPAPGLHKELVLTAGLSLDPLHGTLRALAATLAILSLVVWSVAALAGRQLCRRALAPVTRMAAAARAMGAKDLGERLPSTGTGDELEDLCGSFNGLLGRLQEAFERQRQFTGNASHQLRTPLTALLGQVEVALRRDRPAEEYREALGRAHAQADHLRRVVEGLLFVARADAEGALGELGPLELTAWAADHLARWSTHPRAGDLRLDVAAPAALWVRAQAPLLGQLVDNLLDNACKYSSPGSPVTLNLATDGNWVTLTVADEGMGIAPDDLPHLFEPFYRSAQARRRGRPGVGLGLAVAQRITAAFGGRLDAESPAERGSRFTLRLPVLPKPAAAGGS